MWYRVIALLVLCACASPRPTPEQRKRIEALRMELQEIRSEISKAEEKVATINGRLIRVLVDARIEILKTNEALLQQRIHSLESGIKITLETPGTKPNPDEAMELEEEITKQTKQLRKAQAEAAEDSAGLVHLTKLAVVAAHEQTLAMLRQRYLISKYGLAMPRYPTTMDQRIEATSARSSDVYSERIQKPKLANEILSVRLLQKRYTAQDYQDYVLFDVEFLATGLEKPARAIKGMLNLQDLFGEVKLRVDWTIEEPVSPHRKVVMRGVGFEYSEFMSDHVWVRTANLENMSATFSVKNILYQDGTRVDFD